MIKKRLLSTGKVQVIFTTTVKEASTVHLAGSFNKWNTSATPMQLQPNGCWSVLIELDIDKRYEFRYLVNESEWMDDDSPDDFTKNSSGGMNCVVITSKDAIMPDVEDPYSNTPYEVLSIADDPAVGVIAPSDTNRVIQQQKAKILKSHKREAVVVAKASGKLMGNERLKVDAFLVGIFNPTGNLAEQMDGFLNRPRSAAKTGISGNHASGIGYWLELPSSGEISIMNVEITRSTAYDDPHADLLNVEFDT